MAWTTPITAAANAIFTAAQWNAAVRDNLNVTAPAIATSPGRLIVTTATNAVAEREIREAVVNTSETTASTTYVDLATTGPTISSLTCTAQALVFYTSQSSQTTTNGVYASPDISGATTFAPTDARASVSGGTANKFERIGVSTLFPMSAGASTFKLQYRVSGATGTFLRRRIQVIAL